LTALVLSKIADTVAIIAERENGAFEDAYGDFALSRTFGNLQDMETLLWGENAAYIADDYFREKGESRKK
jgi:hypothetical protein